MKSVRTRLAALGAGLLATASVVVVVIAFGAGAPAGPARNQTAPLVAYTLLDGAQHSSAQWRGKVVLVNFWATTCTSCVREMAQIAALQDRFQARGYDTVAVSMRHDAPAAVVNYARTRRLPFGVAIDNTGAIARSFGNVEVTPTTFVIDKRGRIAERIVGTPDFAALGARIERLLAAPA